MIFHSRHLLFSREPFRASEYYRRNNGSVRTLPYFRGSFEAIGVDDDSDDEGLYSHPPTVFTVHEREYNNDRDKVVCKLLLPR